MASALIAHWLAIVEPRHSWLRYSDSQLTELAACGIEGVSVRAGRPGWQDVACDAASRGLRVSIEAWAGDQDGLPGVGAADGALMGQKFAAWMAELHADGVPVEAARVNAERDVWSDETTAAKRDPNPHAVEYLNALADSYHTAEVGALQYLGFYRPSWHYPGAVLPLWHQSRYQALPAAPKLWVMAYQSTETAIRATLARAADAWPDTEYGAYAAPGRVQGHGVVGTAAGWRSICAHPTEGLRAVTWYIGLDQHDGGISDPRNPSAMIFAGHPGHPPLVELIASIVSRQ